MWKIVTYSHFSEDALVVTLSIYSRITIDKWYMSLFEHGKPLNVGCILFSYKPIWFICVYIYIQWCISSIQYVDVSMCIYNTYRYTQCMYIYYTIQSTHNDIGLHTYDTNYLMFLCGCVWHLLQDSYYVDVSHVEGIILCYSVHTLGV